MRRRDKVFLGLLWGSFLGALAWALSTQFRWVQENKPIQVQRPAKPEAEEQPKESATGVIGAVSDDTLTSMSKGLNAPPPPKAEAKPGQKTRSGQQKTGRPG